MKLGELLLQRLKEAGCSHIFGVPGDFVLGFLNQILRSQVEYVGTCNELNAAYAADAYARVRGLGAFTTTYSVGELSAINGVAGSLAESVPVVCITGIPATRHFRNQPLLHHTLGDYQLPAKIYEHVTVAHTLLTNPDTAPAEIERVLSACLRRKAPVYIGIPSDMVMQVVDSLPPPIIVGGSKESSSSSSVWRRIFSSSAASGAAASAAAASGAAASASAASGAAAAVSAERISDPGALDEAVLETTRLLHESRRPIFIPGVEIARNNLQKDFERLLETSGIPFATMMLSKAILDEDHKQFIGLYCGNRSASKYVQERVETADCVVIFGEKLTDFNTGGFTANLDRRSTIEVCRDCVRIMFHVYNHVYIHDFIRELGNRAALRLPRELDLISAAAAAAASQSQQQQQYYTRTGTRTGISAPAEEFVAEPSKQLTMARFFKRMAHFIKPNSIVIAETGASLFSAAEMLTPKNTKFLTQTFYGAIGYTVGATLGACIAAPQRNVYLFVGDGSFQVTGQELSTMIRYGCTPTIFLINNEGYTIERVIMDRVYNNLQPWKYHELPRVFGATGAQSFDCRTEGDLETALTTAQLMTTKELNFIEIHLDRWDCNESLRKAGHAMAVNNDLIEDLPPPKPEKLESNGDDEVPEHPEYVAPHCA